MINTSLFFTWRRLSRSWLDTSLLILSIAAAVCLLTVLLSLSGSEQRYLNDLLTSSEARSMVLHPGEPPSFDVTQHGGVVRLPQNTRQVQVGLADVQALRREAPAVAQVYITQPMLLNMEAKNADNAIFTLAVSEEFFSAEPEMLLTGSFPTHQDFKEARRVVILTPEMANHLFPKTTAVGQLVQGYRVLGVMQSDVKRHVQAFIPLNPRRAAEGFEAAEATMLAQPGRLAEARAQVQAALNKRWGDAVSLEVPLDDWQHRQSQLQRQILGNLLLGSAGLLVASLGTLSLLLSRVLTRQRQLAVSLALGATKWTLGRQLLGEALWLGTLGALLGLAAAWGCLTALQALDAGEFELEPGLALWTALGSVGVVGLLSLIPASHAIRVRPAEVLRA